MDSFFPSTSFLICSIDRASHFPSASVACVACCPDNKTPPKTIGLIIKLDIIILSSGRFFSWFFFFWISFFFPYFSSLKNVFLTIYSTIQVNVGYEYSVSPSLRVIFKYRWFFSYFSQLFREFFRTYSVLITPNFIMSWFDFLRFQFIYQNANILF